MNKFIIPLIQSLEFKYPTALTLKNNKIFVIHSLGIDICDSLYKTNTNIVEFEQEITKSDLSKISISKFSTGEFVALIIDVIYVFDGYGQKIISCKLEESFNAEYYTLSAHKIIEETDNNFYYFLLGYIDATDLKLNLYYYSLDTNSKSLQTVSKIINYANSMKNTGVSCEFIEYELYELIFCVYEVKKTYGVFWDNDINFSFFKINEGSIELFENIEYDKQNLIYIQSTTKSINSKPFFCGLNEDDDSICLYYDYYDTSSSLYVDNGNQEYCINTPYNIKTYYFPETGEYVFSCLTETYGIQTTIYSKEMTQTSDIQHPSKRLQRVFDSCGEFYYSIIYS